MKKWYWVVVGVMVAVMAFLAIAGTFRTPRLSFFELLPQARKGITTKTYLTYDDLPFLWVLGVSVSTLEKLAARLEKGNIATADEVAEITEGRTLFKILMFFALPVHDENKVKKALLEEKPSWWDLFTFRFPWG